MPNAFRNVEGSLVRFQFLFCFSGFEILSHDWARVRGYSDWQALHVSHRNYERALSSWPSLTWIAGICACEPWLFFFQIHPSFSSSARWPRARRQEFEIGFFGRPFSGIEHPLPFFRIGRRYLHWIRWRWMRSWRWNRYWNKRWMSKAKWFRCDVSGSGIYHRIWGVRSNTNVPNIRRHRSEYEQGQKENNYS